jgi:hypothetical protein
MSAYQDLMTALTTRRPNQSAAEDERIVLAALRTHAHEMAEHIRNTPSPDDPDDYGGFVDMGADWAADLIDPEANTSAGPVRPDEEPTP